ncbi:hypothetical protein LXL04_034478 [Taraxacum kok-saghyz]
MEIRLLQPSPYPLHFLTGEHIRASKRQPLSIAWYVQFQYWQQPQAMPVLKYDDAVNERHVAMDQQLSSPVSVSVSPETSAQRDLSGGSGGFISSEIFENRIEGQNGNKNNNMRVLRDDEVSVSPQTFKEKGASITIAMDKTHSSFYSDSRPW